MFCQVIVDINHEDVDRVFTYRVPKGMTLCPGMRVHVPFGPRKLEGVVVEMVQECDLPPERVKDVADTLEDYPAVLPSLLELAEHIQKTSFCTLAMALRLMVPAQMRGQRVHEKTQEIAALTVDSDVLGQGHRGADARTQAGKGASCACGSSFTRAALAVAEGNGRRLPRCGEYACEDGLCQAGKAGKAAQSLRRNGTPFSAGSPADPPAGKCAVRAASGS